MAALAVGARTLGDASSDGEDRLRPRSTLRVVTGGSARPLAAGVGPPLALDPLTSLALDFGDAPTVILAGDAMPAARVAVYARLIAGGAIAALHPLPDESALAFLKRSVASIDAGVFSAHFGSQEAYDMETIPELGPERLVASFEVTNGDMMHCDITSFDAALGAHDAQLAGALIREVEANASALHAIGPSYAWELARIDSFYDDFECWWDELRSQVEYEKRETLGKKAQRAKIAVSNREVRKHIRESGIRTPGALRNALGRHYCSSRAIKRSELELRIAALPKRPRLAALAVYEIAKRMQRATAALKRILSETDRAALADLSYFTHPALILDADRGSEQSALYEILDERYQHDAQDKGWGPGLALVLDDSAGSVTRFNRAVAALRDLSSAAHDLCEAMRAFTGLTMEAA